MPDFTVKRYGTDPSGRAIWMTVYMHDWWETVVADLGFRPTVVQGAWMTRDGGGAAASAGYHDQAGCMDARTWDLTTTQLNDLVRTCRRHGAAAWRRDETPAHGGMESHCHITLGTDHPLSRGAHNSWLSYVAGRNGLANNGLDYEWRPSPLVTKPPLEDDMPAYRDWAQADKNALAADVTRALLETKLPNKDDKGKKQGTMSVGNFLTNLEWNQDRIEVTLARIEAALTKKAGA